MYLSKAIKGKYPTLNELNAARKKAKNTVDLEMRDGRELFSMLTKLSKFPRVKGIINRRKVAVTAYNWILATDTDADMTEHFNRLNVRIRVLMSYHIDLQYGQFLFEIVPGKNEINNYAMATLKHFDLTEYEKIDDTKFYLFDDNGNKTLIDTTLNEYKNRYIYHTNSDLELGGDIDSIADDIIDLIELKPSWKRLNNKMQGVILGLANGRELANSAAATMQDPLKVIEDLGISLKRIGLDSDNVLQTLSDIDIKLANIVDSAVAGSYKLYKETVEADIAIALLGQANTTELPSSGGSYAALKVLNAVTQDLLFADINTVTDIINKFLAAEYYLSFGGKQCPYQFKFVIDDFEDTEANARTLQYVAGSGVPIKLKKSEVYEKIGYAMPDENDETIDISANSVLASNTPVA